MKVIDFYVNTIVNLLTGGAFVSRKQMSSLAMQVSYDRLLTKKSETKAWCIFYIPTHYNNNITQGIRQQLFKEFPTVETTIQLYSMPTKVNIEDNVFLRRYTEAADTYALYESLMQDLTPEERVLGKIIRSQKTGRKMYIKQDQVDDKFDKYESYNYVQQVVRSGQEFSLCAFIIQASCPKTKRLYQFSKKLISMCHEDHIGIIDLKGNLLSYMLNYGPATFKTEDVKNIEPMLFSEDAIVSQLPTRTKGLLTHRGILYGLECDTKLPFMHDSFESAAAQVTLIAAKSGHGKTLFAFAKAIANCGIGVHCSAIDFKGREWQKVAKYVKTVVIDMDGENPRYVNRMRLDGMIGRGLDPMYVYKSAVDDVVTLFTLIVDLQENEGNESDLRAILIKAVEKVFSQHNVIRDKEITFLKTKDLRYNDIVNAVDELAKQTQSFSEQQKYLCQLIKIRSEPFFSDTGRYSAAFKDELTVAEILDTPMIVYALNKNVNEQITKLDTIKVFMCMCNDGTKQAIRKLEGKYTEAYYEEIQRCVNMRTLVDYISGVTTGSRSSNVNVNLLLNSIAVLNRKEFAAIKSNITTKIVGKVTTDDIKILVDNFDCKSIEDKMQRIVDNKDGSLRNSFAIDYDTGKSTGTALFKVELPQDMLDHLCTRKYNKYE